MVSRSILILLLTAPSYLFSQLSVTATSIPATCPENGTITATASGGAGNYKYTASKAGFSVGPQNSNVFNNLPPGNYTVKVTSGTETANTTSLVADQYNDPVLTLSIGSCGVTAVVTGGTAPFKYRLSSESASGPWGGAQNSPTFKNLAIGQYWVQITDDCGTQVVKTAHIDGTSNLDISADFVLGGAQLAGEGGLGTYTYTLVSNGTPTTNMTGFFPENLFSCAPMTIRVNDGCETKDEPLQLSMSVSVACIKFTGGEATIQAIGGVPPFNFEFVSPPAQSNATGIFTGLPTDLPEYRFKITDACGKNKTVAVNRQTLLFDPTPVLCTNDTLSFRIERGCQNFSYSFPDFSAACPTCTGVTVATAATTSQQLVLTGATPGNISLTTADFCGETNTCRDSVGLFLFAACDSIVAQLADFFICDGFNASKRYLTGPNISYKLFGPGGNQLQANSKGIFKNVPPGGPYKVTATSGVCGDYEAEINLDNPLAFNPKWSATLAYLLSPGGTCEPAYQLKIDIADGPYYLTGGPDQSKLEVDDEHVPTDCADHTLENLLPGDYVLYSRSRCDSVHVHLPEPNFDLHAYVRSDCPGDAVVEVFGTLTKNEWKNWFGSQGLNNWNPGAYNASYKDHYTLDEAGAVNSSPHQGSPYYFENLEAGPHTIYLYAFGSCPVDTVEVVVPEKKKVELRFEPNVVCDGANSMTARCKISEGKPPYTLRQVDCAQNSQVLQTWTSNDTLIEVSGLPLGSYCFRLVDSCGNTGFYEVSVNHLTDTIAIKYQCDETVQLSTDDFPFDYQWVTSAGQPISGATGSSFVFPAPSADTTFSVQINTGDCQLSRTVVVHPAEITPVLDVQPPQATICGDDPLTLTATAAAAQEFDWSTGDSLAMLVVQTTGDYVVTVTNAFGCTSSQTIEVKFSPEQTPEITGPTDLCKGSSITLEGTAGYVAYGWSNDATEQQAEVFLPGTITLQVTDALGCIWEATHEVVERPLPEPKIAGKPTVCEKSTTPLDGGAGFDTYLWLNGQTDQRIEVGGGWHFLSVTNTFGCTGKDSFFVEELPLIDAKISADTAVCPGNGAQISPEILTSATAATFFWSADGVFFGKTDLAQNGGALSVSPSATTVFTLDSIQMPSYQCPFDGLPAASKITVDAVAVSLDKVLNPNGLAISCYGKNDGTLQAQVLTGIAPFEYAWNIPVVGSFADGLPPGTYIVSVTDGIGCVGVDTIKLIEPEPFRPQFGASAPLCFGVHDGQISVEAIPGAQGAVTMSLSPTGQQADAPGAFGDLGPGTYTIYAADALGCEFDTTITFAEPPVFILEFPETNLTLKLGDNLTLAPETNLIAWDSISWTPSDGLSDPLLLSPDAHPKGTTTYVLELFTELGCRLANTVTVTVDNDLPYFAPTAFKPDDSDGNERFMIFVKETATVEIRRLQVFDRWGELMFSVKNPDLNSPNEGWDGRVGNGKAAAPGVYVWEAEIISITGESLRRRGNVLLVR